MFADGNSKRAKGGFAISHDCLVSLITGRCPSHSRERFFFDFDSLAWKA